MGLCIHVCYNSKHMSHDFGAISYCHSTVVYQVLLLQTSGLIELFWRWWDSSGLAWVRTVPRCCVNSETFLCMCSDQRFQAGLKHYCVLPSQQCESICDVPATLQQCIQPQRLLFQKLHCLHLHPQHHTHLTLQRRELIYTHTR